MSHCRSSFSAFPSTRNIMRSNAIYSQRIILLLCVAISSTFLFIVGSSLLKHYQNFNTIVPIFNQQGVTILFNPNQHDISKYKLILVWTRYFGDLDWDFMPQGKDAFIKCPVKNCFVTANASFLLQSDGIIFHARDFVANKLPRLRLPTQRWIFFSLESPHYSYFSGFHVLNGVFNWTMTYRKDSDITVKYGELHSLPQSKEWLLTEDNWKSKDKMAVWMVSHCKTASQRETYVNELQKYISVDMFGKCGKAVCPANHTSDCLKSFAKRYRFYLAFENSICKDYVTEKFFTALKYNMIPIVLGGANYKSIGPPNSFIDALNFSSPKMLAAYLYKVANDYKLYSSYMDWKSAYTPIIGLHHCDLCAKLHSAQKSSVVRNLKHWWIEQSECNNWKNYLQRWDS